MYASCGYPVKSSWLKAVKSGNYMGWPMLTERNVQMHYPKKTKPEKRHLHQTRKNVWSTKVKVAPLEACDTFHLHGKKVRNMYTQMYMVCKTIFSDQTSQFLVQSLQDNKYIIWLW
jgi:hypothetical protein